MERRSIPGGVTIENRADNSRAIVGHAAVYFDGSPESEFWLFTDTVERIMPGAFDATVGADDVRALFNHDANLVLGRTKSGTLRLSADAKGLAYEIVPPDTQHARDLQTSLERGDISGSSFAFEPINVSWSQETRDGKAIDVREIRSVKLYDVGPVTFPAYEGATSGVRSAAAMTREAIDAERAKCRGGATTRSMAMSRARLLEIDVAY